MAAIVLAAVSTAWQIAAAEEDKQPAEPPAAKNAVENPADDKTADPKNAEQPPSAEKPGEKKSDAGNTEQTERKKTPIEEKINPDPFLVPEGTPEELKAFIDKIRKTRVNSTLAMLKARRALTLAAEHIIAAQPEEKEMVYAVQLKMQIIADRELLDEFAEQLKEDGFGKYARIVRNYRLLIGLAMAEREEPENRKAAIESALKFLESTSPEASDGQLALLAGKTAELTGDNRYAAKVYFAAAKSFALSNDKKLIEFGRTLAGMSRRLASKGNDIRIEGFLLNGEKFDWSKYEGKIVLVDFWATWSGSSVAELRKIDKYYKKYHDQGFEIVGVSCDKQPEELKKFVEDRKIPWPIVYGKDKPSPSVEYYGITDIPTKILIGRDGKVILLDARGLKLKHELINIFGPDENNK